MRLFFSALIFLTPSKLILPVITVRGQVNQPQNPSYARSKQDQIPHSGLSDIVHSAPRDRQTGKEYDQAEHKQKKAENHAHSSAGKSSCKNKQYNINQPAE